jgi:hypothetical protein
VEIRDEIEGVSALLELDVLADRPEVVAQMELSGRLNSGQDSHTGWED